ncbi:MAG: aldo/keto reductase [Paenibacillus sp.]|nr:aldo/keto reductase [Paenibacillus sp.]
MTNHIVEQLKPVAERRGWTLAQLALNWVLSKQGITSAILGVSKPQHITEALPVIGEKLSLEELKEIDTITSGVQFELVGR